MAAGAAPKLGGTVKRFKTGSGGGGRYYSLPELSKTYPQVNRLPHSLRIGVADGISQPRLAEGSVALAGKGRAESVVGVDLRLPGCRTAVPLA